MTPPADRSHTVATRCHHGNARRSDQITAKATSNRNKPAFSFAEARPIDRWESRRRPDRRLGFDRTNPSLWFGWCGYCYASNGHGNGFVAFESMTIPEVFNRIQRDAALTSQRAKRYPKRLPPRPPGAYPASLRGKNGMPRQDVDCRVPSSNTLRFRQLTWRLGDDGASVFGHYSFRFEDGRLDHALVDYRLCIGLLRVGDRACGGTTILF
jgi:hypothetical protein